MNLSEYNATKSYRDHLSRTVETARNRLSNRDFQMFAPGIEQEIARLDGEMTQYPMHLLLSCAHHGWGAWVPVTITQTESILSSEPPSVRFNSPPAVTPWTSVIYYADNRRVQASPCAVLANV